VVVAVDIGISKKARDVAERLHAPLAIIEKRRLGNGERTEVMNVIGDVEGKVALTFDDEIDTGTGIERLTPREREVVNLIARGYTYRETARRLEISVKTLETHMSNIFNKLGIASRHELAALVGPTFLRPDDR
jgi:DNA-binding CsgD family transcriptional regulator